MRAERFARLIATLEQRQPDLTLLAENTHKPHNVSALVRTCDAVGMLGMHVVAQTELARHRLTSAGSRKWVRVTRHRRLSEACDLLREGGFRLIAAHQSSHSVDYRDIDYTGPTAIVVGSELWGVSATAAAAADAHVSVPMKGMVQSLNVSVATALVLYEALRQREDAGMYQQCRIEEQRFRDLLFEWAYPRIARRCRQHGRAYPELDDDGAVADNPLDQRQTKVR